jgi:hypothetical protein
MEFSDCKLQTWVRKSEARKIGRIVFIDPLTQSITLSSSFTDAEPLNCWFAFARELRRLSPLELLGFQAIDEFPTEDL